MDWHWWIIIFLVIWKISDGHFWYKTKRDRDRWREKAEKSEKEKVWLAANFAALGYDPDIWVPKVQISSFKRPHLKDAWLHAADEATRGEGDA